MPQQASAVAAVKWRYALADYSQYIRFGAESGTATGRALANALYGRALCLAKLGKRALALRDLDECIRVGPTDEQITDSDASLVPIAHVARFALLQVSMGRLVAKGLRETIVPPLG